MLLATLLLWSCSNEDKDNPVDEASGHPPALMVATWIFNSVTVDGATAPLDSVMEWLTQTVQAKLHIQANSAYVFEEVNGSGGQLWFESGFVFIDGVFIDVNAQLDSDGTANETTRWSFTVDDSVFTLARIDSGRVIQYTLRK